MKWDSEMVALIAYLQKLGRATGTGDDVPVAAEPAAPVKKAELRQGVR